MEPRSKPEARFGEVTEDAELQALDAPDTDVNEDRNDLLVGCV